MTPSGIDLATFRFVAKCLNHCTTAVPQIFVIAYGLHFCVIRRHESTSLGNRLQTVGKKHLEFRINIEDLELLICVKFEFMVVLVMKSRSQWPRGLRRRYAAARLLRLWVRIPPGGMNVCLL